MKARLLTVLRSRRDDERGVAIIILAMFLVVLLIMAAIVVDVGNARQQRASAQAAVDSAALSAAEVLQVNQSSQASSVFDLAANTTYNSLFLHPNYSGAAGNTCTANGVGAVCKDFAVTSNGVNYDVQVTTPFIGPGETTPDNSMLNVKACWNVPAVFGKVVGTNYIPICANATAQNGVATGGPTNGGCGTQTEINPSTITDNFGTVNNSYTITAEYNTTGTTGLPISQANIHFVVQTQYGNFVQIPASGNGVSVPGVSYGIMPVSGNNYNDVTLTYTLPTSIIPNTSDARAATAYSNTFSANLQVTDTAGRNCGTATWTTCNPLRNGTPHDPIFDGGASGDVGTNGWGLDDKHSTTDDTTDADGNDAQANADSDDTVTPPQGSVINAGTAVGAIYNDEQVLRASSVNFVVDGTVVPYSQAWSSNTYTFTDPSTMTSSGSGTPGVITSMPTFGTASSTVSIVKKDNTNGLLQVLLYDNMGNPVPGETVSVTGSSTGAQTSALNGIADFNWPAATGAHTVTYSGALGSGSFGITTTSSPSVSKVIAPTSPAVWPSNGHDTGVNGTFTAGQTVGVMYKTSSSLINGWHSVILFANDSDITTQGGDCGIVSWAFASTGGTNAPGTLHLVS